MRLSGLSSTAMVPRRGGGKEQPFVEGVVGGQPDRNGFFSQQQPPHCSHRKTFFGANHRPHGGRTGGSGVSSFQHQSGRLSGPGQDIAMGNAIAIRKSSFSDEIGDRKLSVRSPTLSALERSTAGHRLAGQTRLPRVHGSTSPFKTPPPSLFPLQKLKKNLFFRPKGNFKKCAHPSYELLSSLLPEVAHAGLELLVLESGRHDVDVGGRPLELLCESGHEQDCLRLLGLCEMLHALQ